MDTQNVDATEAHVSLQPGTANHGGADRATAADRPAPGEQTTSIDPLRRVFVPIERRTEKGTLVFKTLDNCVYVRLADKSIRRALPKMRGKAARRADKLARRAKERS